MYGHRDLRYRTWGRDAAGTGEQKGYLQTMIVASGEAVAGELELARQEEKKSRRSRGDVFVVRQIEPEFQVISQACSRWSGLGWLTRTVRPGSCRKNTTEKKKEERPGEQGSLYAQPRA